MITFKIVIQILSLPWSIRKLKPVILWKPCEFHVCLWSVKWRALPQDMSRTKWRSEMQREITGGGVMHSTAVLQHSASLDQPALSCLLSFFSPQFLLNCSFLLCSLLLLFLLFPFLVFCCCYFSLLLLRRYVLVASRHRLLLLGPLSLFKEPPATYCNCTRFH